MRRSTRGNQDQDFTTFCKKHRLRPVVDREDGTTVVAGRLGQIYEYSDTEVAGMFIPRRLLKGWTHRREQLIKFETAVVVQNGDFEGAVSIEKTDPRIREWVALAQKLLGIRRRRAMTMEQIAAATERLPKRNEMRTLV